MTGEELRYGLELAGLCVFGVSGAMTAVRKGFDVVGIFLLAVITAVGGGILRDLIIGDSPPAAFVHLHYLLLPAAAALVTIFAHPAVDRIFGVIMVFDAAGLALATITGTLKAAAFGLEPVQAALLGVLSGVGGGLLRDVIAREVPVLVRADAELYSVPAACGALTVAFAEDLGRYSALVGLVAAAAIFGLRITAMALGWQAPRAWRRNNSADHQPQGQPSDAGPRADRGCADKP